MLHSSNYLKIPSGNEKIINFCLDELLTKIGMKYGTVGNKPRIRGIKYIVSQVNSGKVGHVKKMIKMCYSIKNKLTFDDIYFYKMHKENYCIYISIIIELIKNDDELLDIIKSKYLHLSKSDTQKTCYKIVWKRAYSALRDFKYSITTDKDDTDIVTAIVNRINNVDFPID